MVNANDIKSARRNAYIAAFDYAEIMKESGYSPDERVRLIRELSQEIVAQFAH